MKFTADHPRGPNGGPMFLGEELCPICECCSLSSEPCDTCGGDGYVEVDSPEGWDEDDDMAQNCDICDGHGGFMTCLGGCNFITRTSHKRRDVDGGSVAVPQTVQPSEPKS